ncbi:hypothetical protein ACH4TV_35045 [Streptomyces sp. NPDC020898]|uniref:hypothetical protein n=1 Tax=Streptomyces sp. NPDC020898 TaxID=3365101 RepID=UPI0037B7D96A
MSDELRRVLSLSLALVAVLALQVAVSADGGALPAGDRGAHRAPVPGVVFGQDTDSSPRTVRAAVTRFSG